MNVSNYFGRSVHVPPGCTIAHVRVEDLGDVSRMHVTPGCPVFNISGTAAYDVSRMHVSPGCPVSKVYVADPRVPYGVATRGLSD